MSLIRSTTALGCRSNRISIAFSSLKITLILEVQDSQFLKLSH